MRILSFIFIVSNLTLISMKHVSANVIDELFPHCFLLKYLTGGSQSYCHDFSLSLVARTC